MSTEIPPPRRWALVGAGRMGTALGRAMHDAGLAVDGPLHRGEPVPPATDAVLLCVPDAAIAAAAALVPPQPGRLVGHCSGATSLESLHPHEAFSLHPLMTVAPADDATALTPAAATGPATALAGAGAAVAGSTPRARAVARWLAGALGLHAVDVADHDRAAYHAAASIAANFLVTLEGAAERLLATTGVGREAIVPLARQALENWAAAGPARALTGPIARGDATTVERQRAAVAERTPELLDVWDALADATRDVASAAA